MTSDLYPEDSRDKGFIKIDIQKGEVTEYSLPKDYEYCINHIAHAKNFIVNNKDEIIGGLKEKLLMWY